MATELIVLAKYIGSPANTLFILDPNTGKLLRKEPLRLDIQRILKIPRNDKDVNKLCFVFSILL